MGHVPPSHMIKVFLFITEARKVRDCITLLPMMHLNKTEAEGSFFFFFFLPIANGQWLIWLALSRDIKYSSSSRLGIKSVTKRCQWWNTWTQVWGQGYFLGLKEPRHCKLRSCRARNASSNGWTASPARNTCACTVWLPRVKQRKDYMVRHGHVPVVMANWKRKDYLRMIQNRQDGQPDGFVHTMWMAQVEELKALGKWGDIVDTRDRNG